GLAACNRSLGTWLACRDQQHAGHSIWRRFHFSSYRSPSRTERSQVLVPIVWISVVPHRQLEHVGRRRSLVLQSTVKTTIAGNNALIVGTRSMALFATTAKRNLGRPRPIRLSVEPGFLQAAIGWFEFKDCCGELSGTLHRRRTAAQSRLQRAPFGADSSRSRNGVGG